MILELSDKQEMEVVCGGSQESSKLCEKRCTYVNTISVSQQAIYNMRDKGDLKYKPPSSLH
jgi:hypothetical protein